MYMSASTNINSVYSKKNHEKPRSVVWGGVKLQNEDPVDFNV